MAARLRKLHQDDVRSKIQTTQLVKRLEDHVLSGVEMSKSQVSAAMGLIRKTLPDLSAMQHTGDPANPVIHEIRRTVIKP